MVTNQRNHIAAILALISLLLLIPAYSLPFMAVSSMGDGESYSLFKSIGALARDGHIFLAVILFSFSFIFPIAKLLLILATVTTFWNIPAPTRHRLKKAVTFTGKYSMLDVLVGAVLVVAFTISDMISFRLLPGLWLFCIAIFVSFAAGQVMNPSSLEPENETRAVQTTPPSTSPRAHRRRWVLPALGLTGILLIAGLVLLAIPLKQPINQATLLKKQELTVSLWPILDKPDYYLTIRLKNGREITTRYYENTPIGNGLIYPMAAVPLQDIQEITVYDHNLIKDEALDRMNVTAVENTGMYYEVHLDGPSSPLRNIGLVLSIVSGALLFLALLATLKRFVI